MPKAKLQFDQIATKQDLRDLKEEITEELGGKLNNLLTAVDGLAKKVGDFQTELYSNQVFHDRVQKNMEALEKRIIRIEMKTGIRRK